jgi:hypothetical protein
MKSNRPCDKLDHRMIGPFKIKQQMSNVSYKLDLPKTMLQHPVFHVAQLEPVKISMIKKNNVPRLEPIQFQNEEFFEVDQILNHRKVGRGYQYLVKLVGQTDAEATWMKTVQLTLAAETINRYHQEDHTRRQNNTRTMKKRR